jgi:hypothetical protein
VVTLLLLLALVAILLWIGYMWTSPRPASSVSWATLLLALAAGVAAGTALAYWFGWLEWMK